MVTSTTVPAGDVLIQSDYEVDGTIAFGGADTLLKGTILARQTATGLFQIYAKGGSSNGNGVPVGVLAADVVATGASTLYCRVWMAGKFRKDRLIIDADGDADNIDFAVEDLLHNKNIYAVDTKYLGY